MPPFIPLKDNPFQLSTQDLNLPSGLQGFVNQQGQLVSNLWNTGLPMVEQGMGLLGKVKPFENFQFDPSKVDTSHISNLTEAQKEHANTMDTIGKLGTVLGGAFDIYGGFERQRAAIEARNRLNAELQNRLAERESALNTQLSNIEGSAQAQEAKTNRILNMAMTNNTLAGTGTRGNLTNMSTIYNDIEKNKYLQGKDVTLGTLNQNLADARATEAQKAQVMAQAGDPWLNAIKAIGKGALDIATQGATTGLNLANIDFNNKQAVDSYTNAQKESAYQDYLRSQTGNMMNYNIGLGIYNAGNSMLGEAFNYSRGMFGDLLNYLGNKQQPQQPQQPTTTGFSFTFNGMPNYTTQPINNKR